MDTEGLTFKALYIFIKYGKNQEQIQFRYINHLKVLHPILIVTTTTHQVFCSFVNGSAKQNPTYKVVLDDLDMAFNFMCLKV